MVGDVGKCFERLQQAACKIVIYYGLFYLEVRDSSSKAFTQYQQNCAVYFVLVLAI